MALGIERLNNNQIRPTSVRAMIRGKKDLLFVMAVTDHKCMATVRNYHPEPEIGERFSGARDIMGIPKKKIRMETVTSKITKTVSKTSIVQEPHCSNRRQTGGRETILNQNAERG